MPKTHLDQQVFTELQELLQLDKKDTIEICYRVFPHLDPVLLNLIRHCGSAVILRLAEMYGTSRFSMFSSMSGVELETLVTEVLEYPVPVIREFVHIRLCYLLLRNYVPIGTQEPTWEKVRGNPNKFRGIPIITDDLHRISKY